MSNEKIGPCKMCHHVRQLCNSHIIPELCYLDSYDAKHRATKVTADGRRHPPLQKGLRQHLLCSECETRLSQFERSFKDYWYVGRALPEPIGPGLHRISGFDYASFKLFHLSILWRASVSTLPEFDAVSLGPYEEKVRQMLIGKDPGPVNAFPIFAAALVDEQGEVVYRLVTKPQQARLGGMHTYYCCYAGCDWTFIVTERPRPEAAAILQVTPQSDGTMWVIAQDWRESNSVQAFVEDRRRKRGHYSNHL